MIKGSSVADVSIFILFLFFFQEEMGDKQGNQSSCRRKEDPRG